MRDGDGFLDFLTASQLKVVVLSLRSLAFHFRAAVQEGCDTGGIVTNILTAHLTGIRNREPLHAIQATVFYRSVFIATRLEGGGLLWRHR